MSINDNINTIGKRLKFFRKSINLTQKEFANSIGISQGNLSEMEKDKFSPSAETLISIIRYYKISADWILTGETAVETTNINAQKNEVTFDPELKRMIDILKELMMNENQHLRGWAIIQFEKAFSEFCSTIDEKKQHA